MAIVRAGKVESLTITLEAAQASLPTPTVVGDGESITTWRKGGRGPDYLTLSIDASAAITLTNPVRLFGWDNDDAVWRSFATLNAGSDIVISAALGHEERVRGAGIYDRLAVGSNGQTGVGNSTVLATPLEVTED